MLHSVVQHRLNQVDQARTLRVREDTEQTGDPQSRSLGRPPPASFIDKQEVRLYRTRMGALNLAKALVGSADATPRDPARASWIDEARRPVRATRPGDGNVSVTAGSEPAFLQLHDALTARLAGS